MSREQRTADASFRHHGEDALFKRKGQTATHDVRVIINKDVEVIDDSGMIIQYFNTVSFKKKQLLERGIEPVEVGDELELVDSSEKLKLGQKVKDDRFELKYEAVW